MPQPFVEKTARSLRQPIIFLDFDGVLNTRRTWGYFPRDGAVDPDKVERVHALCQAFDAVVVISSAWREIFTLCELQGILARRGGLPSKYVIDVTQVLPMPRGQEIKEWLSAHDARARPFVILDDLFTEGNFEGLEAQHIKTTLLDGFSQERYERATENLRRQIAQTHLDCSS